MSIDFDNLILDAAIDIECPSCDKSFEITLNQVGTVVTCPNCKIEIELERDDNFDDEISSARSATDEFNKLLNSFK